MNGRCLMSIGCLLLSGCMMREDSARLARARDLQAAELEGVKQDLAEARKELSQQAAEELELRKRIAGLNERLAVLREENRRFRDKFVAAERSAQAAEKRVKALRADHTRELARARESMAQALAGRETQIKRLEERIRQLEELLARSRAPRNTPSTGATR